MALAEQLAYTLAEVERRLRAVERGSQMPYSSIETADGDSVDVTASALSGLIAADLAQAASDSVAEVVEQVFDVNNVANDAQEAADAAQAAADAVTAEVATIPQQIEDAKADTLSKASLDAQEKADLAKAAAILAASDDATAKANAAQSAATAAAAADAQTKATQAKNDAIAAAALDAQDKADLAKAQALAGAATDAQTKADAAKAAAISTASTDAQSKADAAKAAAISAAATDASTKASNAQTAATNAAATDATTKANNALATAKSYVQSRGTNLVTNGSGLLGDNTNFSAMTFTAADAPPGTGGSFLTALGSNATTMSDELLPVDATKRTRFSFAARQTGTSTDGRCYGFVQPYDAYKNAIDPGHYMFVAGTTTTLAVALKPGDTTITLSSQPTAWFGSSGRPAGTSVHLRRIIAWNYVDPGGKAWPTESYSRNVSATDLWADGAIAGNVITLRAPWPTANGTWAAGTAVSNGSSGGTYVYGGAVNAAVPQTWTAYGDTIVGTVTGGAGASFAAGWPSGTAFARIGWLNNRTTAGTADSASRFAYGAIAFGETVAALYDANNITSTQITDNAITSPKISANAVVAGKIAANAVTAGTIAADAVTATAIAANAVTAGKIAADAITAGVISAGAVGTVALAADAVAAGKIAADAISSRELQANSVIAGKVAANAILAANIKAGEIAAGHLAANSVIAGKIATDAVTAGTIAAGAVVAGKLAANAVVADNIAADAITSTKILAGAVIAGKIGTNAVVADNIAAGAIVAGKIAADAVLATNIKAGEITAVQMKAGTITAASGIIGSIDASKITVGQITAAQIAADALDGKTITGALIRTAASGTRWQMGSTVFGTANSLMGYTADPAEVDPAVLFVDYDGPTGGNTGSRVVLRSGIDANSNFAELGLSRDPAGSTSAYVNADRIDLNGEVGVTASSLRPVQTGYLGSLTSTTSTSFQTFTSGPAVTFVAPASGMVRIDGVCYTKSSVAGQFTECAAFLRTGSTITGGSFVTSDLLTVTSDDQWFRGTGTCLFSGLTPGATYTVYLGYRTGSTSNTASVSASRIILTPCP